MKISIALTVFNEGDNIRNVVANLTNQTYRPDEIVICDGGSEDDTLEKIRGLIEQGAPVKLIEKKGACRGAGRNSAIEAASNQTIALTDAGTSADAKWLENLVSSCLTDPSVEVVYGAVMPQPEGRFSKCLTPLMIGTSNLDGMLCPSVASLLLQKKIWREVGGFPEGLTTAEDLIFIDRLNSHKVKSVKNRNAIVYWSIPSSVQVLFRRFSSFSQGGLAAGFAKRWHYGTIRNFAIFGLFCWAGTAINPWLFIGLPFFQVLRAHKYLSKMPRIKHNSFLDNIYDYSIAGFLLMIMDIATLDGLWRWLIHDHCRRKTINSLESR